MEVANDDVAGGDVEEEEEEEEERSSEFSFSTVEAARQVDSMVLMAGVRE